MNAREAKRLVCAGAAALLDNGSPNLWLSYRGDEGTPLPEKDEALMRKAFGELVAELRRRGERRAAAKRKPAAKGLL